MVPSESFLSSSECRRLVDEFHDTRSAYPRLIQAVKGLPATPTAVAHPCNESALAGAIDAAQMGIITPILVGPRQKILAAADAAKLDITAYEIVDAEHSHDSAAKAVALVREGRRRDVDERFAQHR